jgi:hypothetical protein
MRLFKGLADTAGYEEPDIVYTTSCQTSKYGWTATCPECKSVCCVTYVNPNRPKVLISAVCCNTSQHEHKNQIHVKADNPVIRELSKCR